MPSAPGSRCWPSPPYHYWKANHALHHAHAGKLDKRVGGDIRTLTVGEYRALGWWRRLAYRLLRNPILLLGALTTLHFAVVHRFPWDMPRSWTREWRSVWRTNGAILALLLGAWFTVGVERVLVIQGTLMLYGCAFAGWLTHTQHQFEDAYWRRRGEWNYFDAGLQGASLARAPKAVAVADRQHRPASCASSEQPHSELPVAALPRRESGTSGPPAESRSGMD